MRRKHRSGNNKSISTVQNGVIALFFISSLTIAVNQTGITEHGSRTKPQIALTFDADMTPFMKRRLELGAVKSYNNQVITNYLVKTKTKATFFLSGLWIQTYPDATRALGQNALFELENHSYSHPTFSVPCYGLNGLTTRKDKIKEIQKTKDLLLSVAGIKNKYFRFPGGCAQNADVQVAQSLGLQVVHWDVIGGDGGQTDPNVIVHNVLSNVKNGSIIVLHSHGGPKVPVTQLAVPRIVEALKGKGFEFVTVAELLK